MYNPKNIKGEYLSDIEYLHPVVQELCKDFVNKSNQYTLKRGFLVKPILTFISWENQDYIYNIGRTLPGKKTTNYKSGESLFNWGVAFEIGIFENDKIGNPEADYLYNEISKFKGLLKFGGDYLSNSNNRSYYYTGNYSNADFIKLAKSGNDINIMLS